MEGEGYRDPDIEQVFCFYLGRDEEFDLVARKVPYDLELVDGNVDVLAIDSRDKYAEFVAVPVGQLNSKPAYETLGDRTRELEGWTYSLQAVSDKSVECDDVEEGDDFWISDEADLEALDDFFDYVFRRDVLNSLEPIDEEALDL